MINDLRIFLTQRHCLLQCKFEPTAKATRLPEISLVENLAEACDCNFLREDAPLEARGEHRFADHICMKFAHEVSANRPTVHSDEGSSMDKSIEVTPR